MSNLLEKASILLTPTAYDDGKILSVKPEEVLGSELMPSIATIANLGGGSITQITENIYSSTSDGTSGSAVRPKFDFNTTAGKTYKLVITPIGTITGTINFDFYDGSTYLFQDYDFTTIKEITFTDNGTVFGAFNGQLAYSISNFKVSIKEEIDGDFDFTRNSSATRVNAQGLVEDVQILSSNLVQNGDFSQEGSELVTNGDFATDSDWSLGTGWSIGVDKLVGSNADTSTYQGVGIQVNKSYKIQFTVIDYVSGSVRPLLNGLPNVDGTNVNSNGTYTQYLQSNSGSNGNFTIRGNSFVGSIDNVSVKEVGQDWTFGTGWSIGEDKATVDNTLNANLDQFISGFSGKKVKVSFEISDLSSGGILVGDIVNPGAYNATSNGIHTFDYTATNSTFRVRAYGNPCSITNISVVEITDDTNLPRIDYSPYSGAGTCGHWLFEPQSTNLVTYSEDFSQYGQSGVPTLTSGQLAPDGTFGATKISGTIGSSYIALANASTTTSTRTIYAKTVSGTGTAKLMSFSGNTNNLFTLTEEWQRFELTGSSATGGTSFYIDLRDNAQTLSEFIIWGAQSEELSFATSYIPTNGSTVTRLQDAAFGAGSSDLINSTEGVLYFEAKTLVNGETNSNIALSDGTNNNLIMLRFGVTANRVTAFARGSGGSYSILTINGVTQTDDNKFALVWDSSNFRVWINGTERSTMTINSIPSGMNSLNFTSSSGAENFFGKTKCVAVFKEALTDEELTCLTTI